MSGSRILALAPNGAYKQKIDHPQLPISQAEIVNTAVKAHQAGASLLHLHVRDRAGRHSLDPCIYRRTIEAIENQVGNGLIIQISSEAAGRYAPAQQIACIRSVRPECVSIALRELIPDTAAIETARALFDWCAMHDCHVQYILYDESDLLAYFNYRRQNVISTASHSVLFVLGRYAPDQASSTADLLPFSRHLKSLQVPWMTCAFGAGELNCVLEAARQNGHMRIGFENNLLNQQGRAARDNIQQLRALSRKTDRAGLRLATSQESRRILHMAQRI